MAYINSRSRNLSVLTTPKVAQALGDKSVSLRLTAGTQEAGFLSSFCPIAEFPALIVIKYVFLWRMKHVSAQYPELIEFFIGMASRRSICCPVYRRTSLRAEFSQY